MQIRGALALGVDGRNKCEASLSPGLIVLQLSTFTDSGDRAPWCRFKDYAAVRPQPVVKPLSAKEEVSLYDFQRPETKEQIMG
eukprot:2602743-Pyramimonas_sp.AAC.3